jgi:hypothetical protein
MLYENIVKYRGSKTNNLKIFVKEQRVDGSWFLVKKAKNLRCTLMGFQRNYQIKIHSLQLNRKFSTKIHSNLHSWFVTGLIDGEGTFSTSIIKNTKYKTG